MNDLVIVKPTSDDTAGVSVINIFSIAIITVLVFGALWVRFSSLLSIEILMDTALVEVFGEQVSEASKPVVSVAARLPEPVIPETAIQEDIYTIDRASIPEGCYAVEPYNLGAKSPAVNNETGYLPDYEALLAAAYPFEAATKDSSDPLVLIIHTHGTESFTEEGAYYYYPDEYMRTEDTGKNIVAVGRVMAETFNSLGVPTLHCEIMHDRESYYNSYIRSKETVLEYLEKYPSIKYVFDVHRDSVVRAGNEKLRPITSVDGRTAAQVMFVVGSDFGGANHPLWENNLNVALKAQKLLNDNYGSLSRYIHLREAAFNAQYAPCSLLIEIGACGNYLSEAEYSATLTAKVLASLLNNDNI